MGEDFLRISLFTNVKVELIDENIQHWILTFCKYGGKIEIYVNVEEEKEYICKIGTKLSKQKMKLIVLVEELWQSCKTMYKFALLVDFSL